MTSRRLGVVFRQVDMLLRDGSLIGLSDHELIERFRERSDRSESAFSGLVERHGPMVLGVCRSILRDPNDVDDAFQATFLVLVRRAGSFWMRDSIGPWLHGVASRVALQVHRAADRRRAFEERAAIHEDGPCNEESNAPEQTEAVRLLHEELIRLPERWRGPLVLCHLEGLTHEQASRSLGVPVGTVRSRLSRGRERLKERLIRRGLAPSVAGLVASGIGLGGEGSASIVSASLVQKTVSAGIGLASGWSLASPISLSTFQLTQGVLMSMFLAKAKTAALILVIGGGTIAVSMKAGGVGIADPAPPETSTKASTKLGAGATDGKPPVPEPVAEQTENATFAKILNGEPPVSPTPLSPPADRSRGPLLSTVQIEVAGSKGVDFATGTVISSTPRELIILTCGRIFKLDGIPQPEPSKFPKQTTVKLFSEELPGDSKGSGPPKLSFRVGRLGEVIDYDLERGLALIRTHADGEPRPPASKVVKPSWISKDTLHALAVGCTQNDSPTARPATISKLDEQALYSHFRVEGVVNAHHNFGRAGGGLFTQDGYLFGVATASAPSDNNGTYVTPASIHAFLGRNGMTADFLTKPPANGETEHAGQSFDNHRSPASASPSVPSEPVTVDSASSIPSGPVDGELDPPSPVRPMPQPHVIDPPSSVAATMPSPSTVDENGEPPYLKPEQPETAKPWQTVVRIRILGEGSVGFGSGTVISSNAKDSLVLTSGNHFKLGGKPQVEPANYPNKILVDLFDGKLQGGLGTAKVGPTIETCDGTVLSYDFKRNLALIQIRPGRKLPVSPICSPRWVPFGRLVTAGCTMGKDATIWSTQLVSPLVVGREGSPEYEAIECTPAPKQGRSGGGLFTENDQLVGVCNYAQSAGDRGLYATSRSIQQFLIRAGYASLVETDEPKRAHNVLPGRTAGPLKIPSRSLLEPDLAPVRAEPRSPSSPLASPFEVPARDELPPVADPSKPSSSDMETRLKDVEQKLDRLIKLLEGKNDARGVERR